MNDIHQTRKNHNFEKTYPGCLGRMVNLFELNLGASTNRLLTDKPHRDGSPLSRSRSDVSRMSSSGDHVGDKARPELWNNSSNRKMDGTPMKMLIAQEMSKDVDCRRNPPNLVAKLMGLDALPQQEPTAAMQTVNCRGHPRRHSDIPLGSWEQQNGFFHCVEPTEYKDVYEIWQKSQGSPYKGTLDEVNDKRKMDLVRRKFVEAKRLSMDGKLRQSKQFQDALEVLNSNKDLFLKCLQEPHSMFSQHLYDMQSIPPPPETKRITVLRPSKMVDSTKSAGAGNKDGKQINRSAFIPANEPEKSHLESSPHSNWKNYENPTQPTRIVVLKPSPGRPHDVKAGDSPRAESPRILSSGDFLGDEEDEETRESREVAKVITQQMREKLGRHRRDETLVSSVFSNGYVGDESSFNKSEIDYEAGNLTDSEVISPVSRHSWDYVHRLGSPYSSSSFSRASYSPESSVCREAKKRLSERWAMMAFNGGPQEQRHFRRSSSTLGEMLALSEINDTAVPGEGTSIEEPKDINTLSVIENRTGEINGSSPKNLIRSRSLPVSSTEFGIRHNVGIPTFDKGKAEAAKVETKARTGKSLFKGKVSNLFFSRNKKSGKDEPLTSEINDEFAAAFPGETGNNGPESLIDNRTNHMPCSLMESSSKASFSNFISKQGKTSYETGLPMSKVIASGNFSENQDQPSPISVLNPPFEDDKHSAKLLSHYVKHEQQGLEVPLNSIKSSLIDKSPPIGSISRTLSWDDSGVDTVSSRPIKESSTTQGTEEDEYQELFFFVKTLLSVAGFLGEVRSDSSLAGWHSAESPLDPSLRDRYVDFKDKEALHEAKRRQKRSIQKLVFDCVNLALLEISGYGSASGQRSIPCIGPNISTMGNARPTILDEVWARMNVWFSSEVRCDWRDDEYGDDNSLVVESLVRNEVAGRGWIGHLRLETDNLEKKMEAELLEELVQETVAELTGTVARDIVFS